MFENNLCPILLVTILFDQHLTFLVLFPLVNFLAVLFSVRYKRKILVIVLKGILKVSDNDFLVWLTLSINLIMLLLVSLLILLCLEFLVILNSNLKNTTFTNIIETNLAFHYSKLNLRIIKSNLTIIKSNLKSYMYNLIKYITTYVTVTQILY